MVAKNQWIKAMLIPNATDPTQPHIHGVDGEHTLQTHGNMLNDGTTKQVP